MSKLVKFILAYNLRCRFLTVAMKYNSYRLNLHNNTMYYIPLIIILFMLLQLDEELPIDGKKIGTLSVRSKEVTPGTNCIITGWGSMKEVRLKKKSL